VTFTLPPPSPPLLLPELEPLLLPELEPELEPLLLPELEPLLLPELEPLLLPELEPLPLPELPVPVLGVELLVHAIGAPAPTAARITEARMTDVRIAETLLWCRSSEEVYASRPPKWKDCARRIPARLVRPGLSVFAVMA
jgi:hypothetical protein